MGKKSKKEKKRQEKKEPPPAEPEKEEEEKVAESESDSDSENEENDEAVSQDEGSCGDQEDSTPDKPAGRADNEDDESDEEQVDNDNDNDNEKKKKKRKKSKQVFGEDWLAETDNFNVKLKQRGVLYVARVPPRMTPTKLKNLLSDFGQVTRVYLVEEDKTVRQRRRKQGGSGSKRYTEGWVEFAKKRVAKHVAQSLNTTPISNYKRNVHYGDLWNLKYLHKFKWSHLTEKVAYERRVREQKLRVEMMQARRENASYVELVETGKKLDRIEERKRKRMEKEKGDDNDSNKQQPQQPKKKRNKKQKQPREDRGDDAAKKALLHSLV